MAEAEQVTNADAGEERPSAVIPQDELLVVLDLLRPAHVRVVTLALLERNAHRDDEVPDAGLALDVHRLEAAARRGLDVVTAKLLGKVVLSREVHGHALSGDLPHDLADTVNPASVAHPLHILFELRHGAAAFCGDPADEEVNVRELVETEVDSAGLTRHRGVEAVRMAIAEALHRVNGDAGFRKRVQLFLPVELQGVARIARRMRDFVADEKHKLRGVFVPRQLGHLAQGIFIGFGCVAAPTAFKALHELEQCARVRGEGDFAIEEGGSLVAVVLDRSDGDLDARNVLSEVSDEVHDVTLNDAEAWDHAAGQITDAGELQFLFLGCGAHLVVWG